MPRKKKIEQQLAQEQHKKQRLENRIAYYETRKIGTNGHTTLSPVVQPWKVLHRWQKILTETEFYAFAEKVFDLPEVKGLLMEAVNEHNRAEQEEGC